MTFAPTPEFDLPSGRLSIRKEHLVAEITVLGGRPRAVTRRWPKFALAMTLLVLAGSVANVAFGLGLGGRLHDLVAGKPAPPPIEERLRNEALAERLVPLFAGKPVAEVDKAHGVMAIATSQGPVALWTVPTGGGPVCYLVEFVRLSERAGEPRGDSRCTGRPSPRATFEWALTTQGGLRIVSGYLADNVESLWLRSPEGAMDPVATAERFFLAEVPGQLEGYALIARDVRGAEIRRFEITDFMARVQDERQRKMTGPARTVIETTDSRGRPLRLLLRPSERGETCVIIEGNGGSVGCGKLSELRVAEGVRVHPALRGSIVFLEGSVGPEIATLTLEYEDGSRADVPIVERFVLFSIEREHFREGTRPLWLIGRDRAGREVAREQVGHGVFGPKSAIWLPGDVSP
jgi:hypothetical protein